MICVGNNKTLPLVMAVRTSDGKKVGIVYNHEGRLTLQFVFFLTELQCLCVCV